MMFLVIDIVKGIQTQTAECLIIGEICCDKILIILNKLDLIEESKREATIEKMSKRLWKTLENTKFANSPIVAVAANQQSSNAEAEKENLDQQMSNLSVASQEKAENNNTMFNIDVLLDTLKNITYFPEKRNENGQFLFAVDHCFTIKGQGAIMTGTILNGSVKVNDNIEIPVLKTQKKVKSIQVFRKPVEKAIQGDRCGICLTNFDSKQFERGLVCAPNYVKTSYAVIIKLNKIKHFKGSIQSGSKFHITINHETHLAKIELFGGFGDELVDKNSEFMFDFGKEYLYVNEYAPEDAKKEEDDSQASAKTNKKIVNYYALIDFTFENASSSEIASSGVLCVANSLLIGSKLDTDIHLNQCRIAFYGNVLHAFTNKDFRETNQSASTNAYLSSLKIYKEKFKEGVVERKHDNYTLIGKSLFKKETNIDLFVGLKVSLSTSEQGVIEGNFGQSGKFKIRIPNGLLPTTNEQLDGKSKKKQDADDESQSTNSSGPIKIFLNFKRFIYDEKKNMIQYN